jgi:hypothetical protein
MRKKDYFIVLLMIVVVVWATHPTASPTGAVLDRPVLAAIVKFVKQAAWFSLIFDEPPQEENIENTFKVVPDELVNQPPARKLDADGVAIIDHSDGW